MLRFPLSIGMVLLTAGNVADQPVLHLSWQTGDGRYRVNFVDLPCDKVMEELERLTGLYYLSKDVPDVRITFRTDEPVSLETLFEQIDKVLEPHGWSVIWKTQSFCLYPIDAIHLHSESGTDNIVPWADLRKRPKKLIYKTVIPVRPGGVEEAERVARQFDWTFKMTSFGEDKILTRGRGRDLLKFMDEMGEYVKK